MLQANDSKTRLAIDTKYFREMIHNALANLCFIYPRGSMVVRFRTDNSVVKPGLRVSGWAKS